MVMSEDDVAVKPAAAAAQQPEPKPIFWIRHEPGFCTTGSVYGQPLRAGLLREDFRAHECGAIDAPQYLPRGAVEGLTFEPSPRIASEHAQIDRDIAGQMAAPPQDGNGDDHYFSDYECWGDDEVQP